MVPLSNRAIVQISYVVTDLDAAIQRWATVFGVGPFFKNPDIKVTDPLYRGEPTELRFAGATAHAGEVQVELMQQLNDVPSCYRDLFPAGQEGMHHVAFIADDFDAALAQYTQQGFEVAFSGSNRGMRFAYVDTSPMLGIMVEVIEDVPSIRKAFERTKQAARDWDGVDPFASR